MRSLWKILTNPRPTPKPIKRRPRDFPRFEELEVRNLLTVITPFSLAQQLRSGFSGNTPAQILAAYGTSSLGSSATGQGQTIAIVDAYLSPDIQTDLSTFDAKFNLPAINLTVVNDGATRQDPTGGWELETALDVEWAHAIAPHANIVLVEAANDLTSSAGAPTALLHAVTVAAGQPGVSVVSMSWGVSEFATETQFDSTFAVPNVTFVAASGDSGAPPIWPAVSPNVVAVGGTTLQSTTTTGVYVETGWGNGAQSSRQGGSGGGISKFEPAPAYQANSDGHYISSVTSSQNSGGKRESPDVSYDANPSTGVAVYDQANGGWQVVGGTSAGTPQFAALIALADQERAAASPSAAPLSSSQTLTALYQEQGDFYDVTSGNNGAAAGTGYDLVTGLGTPQANLLVPALAMLSTASGTTTADPARTTNNSGTGGNGGGTGGSGTTSSPDFVLTGTQVTATSGQTFTGTVATISGTSSTATAGSFSAIILWGDGTISAGTVTADPAGGFDVTGTHTYTIHNSPGWGGGWGGYQFGWGRGGSGQSSSSTEAFRITVIVGDSSQEFALTYSTATVSTVNQGSQSSPIQNYLEQLYQELLGRTADSGALNYWGNAILSGTALPTIVVQIEGSQEYLTDEVQTIYQKLLQRQADSGGLSAFTNELAHGTSLTQVEETIAGSPEYYQTRGNGQTTGFIDALFTDALNRQVDPSGTAALEQAIASGASHAAAAAIVFGSAEYTQDLVEGYYQTFLGRQADTGGLDSFMTTLQQGGTDQGVVGTILGSQEFYQKAQ
jgi:Domain of unknown function (DUF4214)